jgi:putative nucleotidyltransferase with HDIG domain
MSHLDACLFAPHTRAGVIAHRLDDAKVIFRDKVRFPYDRVDEGLRAAVPAVQDSADQLTFGNNSSLRVSTSMRSGTLQLLHVSEFGKICAQYPDKAREIVTGALNTVEAGQFVVIESTAEGQEGAFFDMAQKARARALSGAPLTSLDYRFHFFPWRADPGYALADASVAVGAEDGRYFEGLEAQGISLTMVQKRWWVRKAETLGGDMKREYPATPDEAWALALAKSSYRSIKEIPPAGNPGVMVLVRGDQTDHIRGVTRLAIKMADEFAAHYPELEIDRDIVVAGGICHDIGKPWEFDPENRKRWEASPRKAGKPSIRHPAFGAHICLTVGLPEEIAHIATAHSGEGELLVRSLENTIVNYADHAFWHVLVSGNMIDPATIPAKDRR